MNADKGGGWLKERNELLQIRRLLWEQQQALEHLVSCQDSSNLPRCGSGRSVVAKHEGRCSALCQCKANSCAQCARRVGHLDA